MAALLHKLLRKPSTLRTITTFTKPQSLNTIPSPLFLHQPNLVNPKSQNPNTPYPSLGSQDTPDRINPPQQFYPTFSFQHFLDPISPFGVNLSEVAQTEEAVDVVVGDVDVDVVVGDVDVDGGDKMWADSVKKKRKKKMNKHKYKKLRKRLRRKT